MCDSIWCKKLRTTSQIVAISGPRERKFDEYNSLNSNFLNETNWKQKHWIVWAFVLIHCRGSTKRERDRFLCMALQTHLKSRYHLGDSQHWIHLSKCQIRLDQMARWKKEFLLQERFFLERSRSDLTKNSLLFKKNLVAFQQNTKTSCFYENFELSSRVSLSWRAILACCYTVWPLSGTPLPIKSSGLLIWRHPTRQIWFERFTINGVLNPTHCIVYSMYTVWQATTDSLHYYSSMAISYTMLSNRLTEKSAS